MTKSKHLMALFIMLLSTAVASAQSNWVKYDNFNDNSLDHSRWDVYSESGGNTPGEINGALKFTGTGSNEPYSNLSMDQRTRLISGWRGTLRLSSTSSNDSGIELMAHLGQYYAFALLEKKLDGSVIIRFELEDPDAPDSEAIIWSHETPAVIDTDYVVSLEVDSNALTFSATPDGGVTVSKNVSGHFPLINYCAFAAYYDDMTQTGSYEGWLDNVEVKKGSVTNWELVDDISNGLGKWTAEGRDGADTPSAVNGKIKFSGSGNSEPWAQALYSESLDSSPGYAADLKLSSNSSNDSGVGLFCGLTANGQDYSAFNEIIRDVDGSYKISFEIEGPNDSDLYEFEISGAADTWYNLAIVASDTHIQFLVNGEEKGSYTLANASYTYVIADGWYDVLGVNGSFEGYLDSFYKLSDLPTTLFVTMMQSGQGSVSPSAGITEVNSGNSLSYTITPNSGQRIKSVFSTTEGTVSSAHEGSFTYTFSSLSEIAGLEVEFEAIPNASLIPRYRLYNSNNPKHHFTTDLNEYNVLGSLGWNQEGIAYYVYGKDDAAVIDGQTATPFYRVYNPNEGRHLWTTGLHEYNVLASIGWNQEGVDSRIFTSAVTGSTPLYRLYNPNEGKHLWSIDANERKVLISLGWNDEGVTGEVFKNP